MMRRGEQRSMGRRRGTLLTNAHGRTFEIGAGTGANIAHYPDGLEDLTLAEPFEPMRRQLERKLSQSGYDEDLANRIRELVALHPDVTEQPMFGGLAFLIGGHMSVSVSGRGGLLLRCHPEETEALLAKPHASPFEMRGREMRGWLRVQEDGVRTKRQLERWVERGVSFARSLPAKH